MSDQTRPAAADTLGNAGPPHTLRWGGKLLPVAFPCLNTVKRVELYVVRHCTDALEEARPAYSPAEYADRRAALTDAVAAREFAAGGRLWDAVMGRDNGLFGVALTVWACVAEGCDQASPPVACPLTPDDVREALAADDPEVATAAAVVTPDFFAEAGRRMRLPPAEIAKRVAKMRAGLKASAPTS